MKCNKRILGNQEGFTLIEIIAVLVLLGILAAVAIPKYIDLQTQAKTKAAEAAVAEGVAQVNMAAAKYILTNSSVPSTLSQLTHPALDGGLVLVNNVYDAGDFNITFADVPLPGGAAGTTGAIKVTADGTAASVTGATATKTIPLPQ
ncbi:MAG: type II secretion system GspH family protein [Desulfobulbaceae bacterium]|nr:type II secretion system GspH family protein [Desulfobulbaceae bacterium]